MPGRDLVTDPIICDLIPSMMASLLTYTDTPPTTMARDTIPDDTAMTLIIFCMINYISELFREVFYSVLYRHEQHQIQNKGR